MDRYSNQGKENLEILDKADDFVNWMYSEIKPYIFGDILEIGSGGGTYSKKLINDFDKEITLSDIDPVYIDQLKKRFGKYKNVEIRRIDLGNASDFNFDNKIDTVIALNVLEHIKDDVFALQNIYGSLNNGRRLILLVPAHKPLFNVIDTAVGHYRRYNRKELIEKIKNTPFKIKTMFYFNFFQYLDG